jgi:hypothetical protein
MQYIQVDTNFRSTRKFESQILDLQNYFYPFLNLVGICKKGKIKSLKKKNGPGRRTRARPAQIRRPAWAWRSRISALPSDLDQMARILSSP